MGLTAGVEVLGRLNMSRRDVLCSWLALGRLVIIVPGSDGGKAEVPATPRSAGRERGFVDGMRSPDL